MESAPAPLRVFVPPRGSDGVEAILLPFKHPKGVFASFGMLT